MTSPTLAACGANVNKPPLTAANDTPPPPPELPADIRACIEKKYVGEVRKYTTGEMLRIVKLEGNKLDKVGSCLRRLICSTIEYRVLISKVEGEKLCEGSAQRLGGQKLR